MNKKIKILIPRDGISTGKRKPVIEGEGFVGEECTTATSVFTRQLGDVSEELKPEFYERPPEVELHNELE